MSTYIIVAFIIVFYCVLYSFLFCDPISCVCISIAIGREGGVAPLIAFARSDTEVYTFSSGCLVSNYLYGRNYIC